MLEGTEKEKELYGDCGLLVLCWDRLIQLQNFDSGTRVETENVCTFRNVYCCMTVMLFAACSHDQLNEALLDSTISHDTH